MKGPRTLCCWLVCLAICAQLHADATVIIDIDAKTQNTEGSAEDAFFDPGTYKIVPVGVAEGGQFDAWQTDTADPGSWVNGYTLVSEEFPAVTTSDRVTYDSAGQALDRAMNSMFTLTNGGPVRFYLDDDFFTGS